MLARAYYLYSLFNFYFHLLHDCAWLVHSFRRLLYTWALELFHVTGSRFQVRNCVGIPGTDTDERAVLFMLFFNFQINEHRDISMSVKVLIQKPVFHFKKPNRFKTVFPGFFRFFAGFFRF